MSADTVAAGSEVIGDDRRAALVRLVRTMFPHEGFPDGPYERTVDALLADTATAPRLAGLLVQGTIDLDRLAGRPFAELDRGEAHALLERIQGSPFFLAVQARAISTLYDDPEVWEILGYEGPSFDRGGYLTRGFDDLDWLPDPPL